MVEATPDDPQAFDPLAWYLAGYLKGHDAGRAAEDADIARLHSIAYRSVQANAKLMPYAEHWAATRARQEASCEALKRAAVPWPDEVDP
jgi:hypothetical protein